MVGPSVLMLGLAFFVGSQAYSLFEEGGDVLEGQWTGVLVVGQGEFLKGAGGFGVVLPAER